ncbi:ATP-binding protein [Fulvivirgaceae bacterium BMA12]|uniref:histidine kinase n=1 Tax=Agaribacillus aureus TaxID=3051825 RepID=A0ABT8KYN8_9BACT|nr:ATP-binding protein [Fulvivirgaceae bacterium BMA12]
MSTDIVVTIALVLAGGAIMFLAILGTRRIFKLLSNMKYRRNWRLLLYLMVFFFLGYLVTAYIVWQGFTDILNLLTGIVFFFGATFVYIVVQSGLYTIHDLKTKTADTINQAQKLKLSQEKLQLINKALNTQNQELEQFNYIVSHDLQEPLRTISSVIHLMELEYGKKLGKEGDQYLTFISEASDRMRTLIKSLLNYSRLGEEDRPLEKVDCNMLAEEVIQSLDAIIRENQAIITVDTLPVLYAYRVEMMQLFQNLLSNAIKFHKKDAPPEISISANKEGAYWKFSFTDKGIGIEEEYREKIFVIFQRLHSKGEYEGTGIGLAHCKKIVEMHQGKIWVESETGEGSTFHFTILENKLRDK